jgi:hypothetical protein
MCRQTIREQAQTALTDLNCTLPTQRSPDLKARSRASTPIAEPIKRAIDRLTEIAYEIGDRRCVSRGQFQFRQDRGVRHRRDGATLESPRRPRGRSESSE